MAIFVNGLAPLTALRAVRGESGAYLLEDAAIAWERTADECERQYGWRPRFTSAGDAYRSLDRQVKLFLKNYTTSWDASAKKDRRVFRGVLYWRRPGYPSAATPGFSNHGRGLAVDVTGLGGWKGERQKQFMAVARIFGFNSDEGSRIDEPWHKGYDPARDQYRNRPYGPAADEPVPAPEPPEPPEEDDVWKTLILAKLPDHPDVFVGNGITRRRIATEQELWDLQYRIRDAGGSGAVHVVERIDWLGNLV